MVCLYWQPNQYKNIIRKNLGNPAMQLYLYNKISGSIVNLPYISENAIFNFW